MAIYHFSWDLGFFGLIDLDVTRDPAWRLFAKAIASTFLLLVGVSLVLAVRNGFKPRPYFRRLALIAAGAALVSFGTWLFTPNSFVFFGVLHCIALASVLALPFLYWPLAVVLAAAALTALAPSLFRSDAFNNPWFWWTGLNSSVSATNDYIPLTPWFAAVLAGIALARFALPRLTGGSILARAPRSAAARLLAFGGRHSLFVYLAHQPLLIGLILLFAFLFGLPRPGDPLADFNPACIAGCAERGADAEICRAVCLCVAEELRGLPSRERRRLLAGASSPRLTEAIDICRTLTQPAPRLEPDKR